MSQVTKPTAIPQELLDLVIDYLHDDKDTLRSCSLASKCLVDATYYHLFRSVTVKILTESRSQTQAGQKWDDFVTFVAGEPTAAGYIRRLCLDTPNPPTSPFEYHPDSYRTYPTLHLQSLVQVLGYLPSLEHLELYHLRIMTRTIEEHTLPHETHARCLRSLSLCWCALDDKVLALPAIFQAIRPLKVSLHHVRCVTPTLHHLHCEGSSALPLGLKLPMRVQSLQIIGAFPVFGCCDDDDLLRAIPGIMTCTYPSLREITLIGRGWEHNHFSKSFST